VLRALAAWKLLRKRKFLRCCAAEKTAIHASRSGNDTLKDQVANKADNRPTKVNVCFRRLSLEEHEKWTVLSNCSS
jgi:hypothetical protein